jgi:SlyX protein
MSDAITRLEEKIAYLERHVVEQDKAMLEFAEELARLKRELNLVSGRLASGSPGGAGETQSIEERPPHY